MKFRFEGIDGVREGLLLVAPDLGIELTDAGDRAALAALSDVCARVAEKLGVLRDVHRAAWMTYYKPQGWEVMELRYGGMRARAESAKARIDAYLAGEIPCIGELEEERLRFDCLEDCPTHDSDKFDWYSFGTIASAGVQ